MNFFARLTFSLLIALNIITAAHAEKIIPEWNFIYFLQKQNTSIEIKVQYLAEEGSSVATKIKIMGRNAIIVDSPWIDISSQGSLNITKAVYNSPQEIPADELKLIFPKANVINAPKNFDADRQSDKAFRIEFSTETGNFFLTTTVIDQRLRNQSSIIAKMLHQTTLAPQAIVETGYLVEQNANASISITRPKGAPLLVRNQNETITISDQEYSVSFPASRTLALEAIQIKDGILSIGGSSRLIDLREFAGEALIVGNTEPLKTILMGDGEAYPILETIDSVAPDLVQKARNRIAENKVRPELEATDPSTANAIIGNLYDDQSSRILGESGSGKSSEIFELAERIAAGKQKGVPRTLQLRELSFSALQAGTEYVGMAAARANAIIAFCEAYRPVIFADEFHQIAGVGTSSGSPTGAMDQIKPALEKGTIRFIAVSTAAEWNRAFGSNPAFDRRFTDVTHKTPVGEDLNRKIRNSVRLKNETALTSDVLEKTIQISNRFSISGAQPAVSIKLYRKAMNLQRIKGNFHPTLTLANIEEAAAELYHVDSMYFDPARVNQAALKIRERLKKQIIGQEASVDAIEEAVIRIASGVGSDGDTNVIGYFGPPGTGKSLSAKMMAKEMKLNVELIAMNAYESGNVEAFRYRIWEALEKSPSTVFIIDEVNRAPKSIQNALLDIIQEKKFSVTHTTNDGRPFFKEVRSQNAVFVWNTNAGEELLTRANVRVVQAVGYKASSVNQKANTSPIDPRNIKRATIEAALIEGNVSSPLISRTQDIIGMPRPDRKSFEASLRRDLDQLLANESKKRGLKISIQQKEKYLAQLMTGFDEGESDYRTVQTILKSETEMAIARALIDPKLQKSKGILISWTPNDVGHKICSYALHFRQ